MGDPNDKPHADPEGDTGVAEAGGLDVPKQKRERKRRYHVGDKFGRYIIEESLGSGGMGSVYAAHDPQLDRHVAIKHLHDEVAQDATVRRRAGPCAEK